jgi:hypothetical protein
VVIEYPRGFPMPFNVKDGSLVGLRNRQYGGTGVAIYQCYPAHEAHFRSKEFNIMPKESIIRS